MHAYQLRQLIEELKSPDYDGFSAAQAWGHLQMGRRYAKLRETVFLSRQEIMFRRQLGVLAPPYVMVPEDEACAFPEGLPGLPARLPYASFQQAWHMARG